ncbi:hypothetical protein [Nostoc sp. CHAB 5715]|nr:hypothetical protein [Nostoc sp. CHAB 5715]
MIIDQCPMPNAQCPMPHAPFPILINKTKNRVFTRFLTTFKSSVF